MRFALVVNIETKNAGPVADMEWTEVCDVLLVAFERDGFEAIRHLDWIIDFDVNWVMSPATKDTYSICPHGRRGPVAARPCGCQFVEVPWSEVAMHMRIAGKGMWACPVDSRMVQLYDTTHQKFSAPVLFGEAGYRRD